MTEKRYKRLVSSIDYYYCTDNQNENQGLTEKDMLNRLNEQDERIKGLEKENRGLQFKIIDMLDFVKEKGTVTREEIKKWWNGDVE